MKAKTEHLLIGGLAITAVAAIGISYMKKHHHTFALNARAPHRARTSGLPYQARMAVGKTAHNSGVTNVGLGTGWSAPTAGGYKAHLNPGPWSYLTARNENYTYSHPPTNRLLKSAGLGTNATHKVQGAEGYTLRPWEAIYTYY